MREFRGFCQPCHMSNLGLVFSKPIRDRVFAILPSATAAVATDCSRAWSRARQSRAASPRRRARADAEQAHDVAALRALSARAAPLSRPGRSSSRLACARP